MIRNYFSQHVKTFSVYNKYYDSLFTELWTGPCYNFFILILVISSHNNFIKQSLSVQILRQKQVSNKYESYMRIFNSFRKMTNAKSSFDLYSAGAVHYFTRLSSQLLGGDINWQKLQVGKFLFSCLIWSKGEYKSFKNTVDVNILFK